MTGVCRIPGHSVTAPQPQNVSTLEVLLLVASAARISPGHPGSSMVGYGRHGGSGKKLGNLLLRDPRDMAEVAFVTG